MNIELGAFIIIAFGSNGTCPARVEGFTKTGKLVIRRFNKSRDCWYGNTAKIDRDVVRGLYSGPVIMFKKIPHERRYNRKLEQYVTVWEESDLPALI